MSPGITATIYTVFSFVCTIVQPNKTNLTKLTAKIYGSKKRATGNENIARSRGVLRKSYFFALCKSLGITTFCKTCSALARTGSSGSYQQ